MADMSNLVRIARTTAETEWGERAKALPADGTIDAILHAIRNHLHMDVAFVSEFVGDQVVIRHLDAVSDAPMERGAAFPLQKSYCRKIVNGMLPQLIPDTSEEAEALNLDVTRSIPVGAHLSVPIRMKDGSIYGTFCCFSFQADTSLNKRDLDMLKAFADIASDIIESSKDHSTSRKAIADRIDDAIARRRFQIVYQPVYTLADGCLVGFEALTRFEDAGMRAPDHWFREAEKVGMGPDLEIATALAALNGFAYIPAPFHIAVNLSPTAILAGALDAILERAPANRLVVEITEHSPIDDYPAITRALAPWRHRIKVAVDDTGAGFASLRHILDLSPDIIKIDNSITQGIDSDPARRALGTALSSLGRDLGCQIIAEGVETQAEHQTIRDLGIEMAQGYYLGRPMPLAAAGALVVANVSIRL